MDLLLKFKPFSKKRENSIPSSLRVGDTLINNLKPLGGIFKPGITKAGRISFCGRLPNGTKVKVYESFNKKQIKLRKKLSTKCEKGDVLFPKVLINDENFIVEEWIMGKAFSKLKPNSIKKYSFRVIKFIEMIHFDKNFFEIAKANNNSFCYLSDYLINRLKPWQQWLPVEGLLKKWEESNSETKYIIESRISHPDLSLSNVILGDDEKIYIIDNELIGVGKGWLLDEKNSFFRLKVTPPKLEPITQRFYELSWKLRLVGSALDSGDFAKAERMSRLDSININ